MSGTHTPNALPGLRVTPPARASLLRLRSDSQLVAMFRAGSQPAFGVLHDRYAIARVATRVLELRDGRLWQVA